MLTLYIYIYVNTLKTFNFFEAGIPDRKEGRGAKG